MDTKEITRRFVNHPPSIDGVAEALDAVTETMLHAAATLDALVPEGREKALALTNLEQTSMWAKAAIARSQGVAADLQRTAKWKREQARRAEAAAIVECGEPNKGDEEDCESCALNPELPCRYHQGYEDGYRMTRPVGVHVPGHGGDECDARGCGETEGAK